MPGTRTVIIGQGYVGLPVAMRAVDVGHHVFGVDLDERRATALREGRSYVEDISDAQLQDALDTGRYVALQRYERCLDGFDVAVITVPTPLHETAPDLTYVEQAAESIAPYVRRGATVILESTTYPGTTEELVVPILECGSGLRAGEDFFVGYSPERIDPGNARWGFVETPKVVSGINDVSRVHVDRFYGALVDTTVPVSGTREAELTKLLENTFRHVNIALVNELAIYADQLGIDVWESIDAAATKPFGFMKFTPGPGVGGHCLPVDPSYLSWQVRRTLGRPFRFVDLANDVNDHMPDHVVGRIAALLNEQGLPVRGAHVLLVGLAYKKDSGDVREAPSRRVIELLQSQGARVSAADPHVDPFQWPGDVARVELGTDALDDVDLAVVLTDHSALEMNALRGVPTFDTRNVIEGRDDVVVL